MSQNNPMTQHLSNIKIVVRTIRRLCSDGQITDYVASSKIYNVVHARCSYSLYWDRVIQFQNNFN